jgi:F-type H+-transporting ATPase subunit b
MAEQQPQHSLTGAEAPGGHGAAFPPFQSETFASQLLWLAIAFGLLYYLMSRVALPRIGAILHDRSQRLASDLEEAQRLKSDADAASEAYETSLREARANAERIAQEMRGKVAAEADARRKTLEAELKDRLAAAETAIAARRTEAMGNVRSIAAETATAIVERLIGQTPDRAAIEGALDRALTTRS